MLCLKDESALSLLLLVSLQLWFFFDTAQVVSALLDVIAIVLHTYAPG